MPQTPANDDVWLPNNCEICSNRCGIVAHRVNGVVVKIEGDPQSALNEGRACSKGLSTLMAMYSPHRVAHPLKRTNPEKGLGVDPKWQQISWDEALNMLEAQLRRVRQDDPRKLVIGCMDNAVMGQVVSPWGQAYGSIQRTRSFFNPGAGKHVSSYLITGTFQQEPDLALCRYLMIWGNQYGFGAQKGATLNAQKMADARLRGMKVVVIDPVLNAAAAKADEWVPIRPATDACLILALVNLMVNELGVYDAEYLKHHSNGGYLIGPDQLYVRDPQGHKPLAWDAAQGKAVPYDEAKDPALDGKYTVNGIPCEPAFQRVREHVKRYTPEYASKVTTVPEATIRRLAKEYGEAANIGGTIVVEGKSLPFRPAASIAFAGIYNHAHGGLNGLALQLLNIVIGNTFVPGGTWGFNLVGPDWRWGPRQEPDGMLAPPEITSSGMDPYHTKVKVPETPGYRELFPLGDGSAQMLFMNLVHDNLFQKLPVKPEMLISCRSNFMQGSTNAEQLVEAMKHFSFVVCFSQEIDEVAEFADLVLPDAHQLERLVLFPNEWTSAIPTGSDFIWRVQVPVVDPPGEARCWREAIIEMGHRLGISEKMYQNINRAMKLKEPFQLDPKSRYTYEEMADRAARSMFRPDKGLDWMKQKMDVRIKRKVDELYPLHFMKARIPLYHEVAVRHGQQVKAVTAELDIPWDVSDYQPIPDWKPDPSYTQPDAEHDLIVVFYKFPFHAHTTTGNNPWLVELTERHPYGYKVRLHPEVAARKGLKDGDTVWIESEAGRVKGELKLTEGIHPEVIAIGGGGGAWAKGKPVARGRGIHFGTLLPLVPERFDYSSGQVDGCIRVKVYRAE